MRRFLALIMMLGITAQLAASPAVQAGEPQSIAALRQKKLEVSKKRYEAMQAAFDEETVDLDTLYSALLGWKEASYEIAATPAERTAALEAHRDRINRLYQRIHALHETASRRGEAPRDLSARFWLLEAEIWVLEAKQSKK
jgi:hypothetical protein